MEEEGAQGLVNFAAEFRRIDKPSDTQMDINSMNLVCQYL